MGAVIGAAAGTIAGFLAAMLIGILMQKAAPDDPSSCSVAIVVILTAPAGFLCGMLGGAALGWTLCSKKTEVNQSQDVFFPLPKKLTESPRKK
jgi:hypothetical protein